MLFKQGYSLMIFFGSLLLACLWLQAVLTATSNPLCDLSSQEDCDLNRYELMELEGSSNLSTGREIHVASHQKDSESNRKDAEILAMNIDDPLATTSISLEEFRNSYFNHQEAGGESDVVRYLKQLSLMKIDKLLFISPSAEDIKNLVGTLDAFELKSFEFYHLKASEENEVMALLSRLFSRPGISLTLDKMEFQNSSLKNDFLLLLRQSTIASFSCSAGISEIFDYLPQSLNYLSLYDLRDDQVSVFVEKMSSKNHNLKKIFLDSTSLDASSRTRIRENLDGIIEWKVWKSSNKSSLLNFIASKTQRIEAITEYFAEESVADLSFISEIELLNEISSFLDSNSFPHVTSLRMRHVRSDGVNEINRLLVKLFVSCEKMVNVDFSYSYMSDCLCPFLNAREMWENVILWQTAFQYRPMHFDASYLVLNFISVIPTLKMEEFIRKMDSKESIKLLNLKSGELEYPDSNRRSERKKFLVVLQACHSLYQLQLKRSVKFLYPINQILDLRPEIDSLFHLKDASISLYPLHQRLNSINHGILDLSNINYAEFKKNIPDEIREIYLSNSLWANQVNSCIKELCKINTLRVIDLRGNFLTDRVKFEEFRNSANMVLKVSLHDTGRSCEIGKLLAKIFQFEEVHIDAIDRISAKNVFEALKEKKLKRLDLSKLSINTQSHFLFGWLRFKKENPSTEVIKFRLFGNKPTQSDQKAPSFNLSSRRLAGAKRKEQCPAFERSPKKKYPAFSQAHFPFPTRRINANISRQNSPAVESAVPEVLLSSPSRLFNNANEDQNPSAMDTSVPEVLLSPKRLINDANDVPNPLAVDSQSQNSIAHSVCDPSSFSELPAPVSSIQVLDSSCTDENSSCVLPQTTCSETFPDLSNRFAQLDHQFSLRNYEHGSFNLSAHSLEDEDIQCLNLFIDVIGEELREFNASFAPREKIQSIRSLLEHVLQKARKLEQVDLRGIYDLELINILHTNKPASLKIVKISCTSSIELSYALKCLSQYEEVHLDVQSVDEWDFKGVFDGTLIKRVDISQLPRAIQVDILGSWAECMKQGRFDEIILFRLFSAEMGTNAEPSGELLTVPNDIQSNSNLPTPIPAIPPLSIIDSNEIHAIDGHIHGPISWNEFHHIAPQSCIKDYLDAMKEMKKKSVSFVALEEREIDEILSYPIEYFNSFSIRSTYPSQKFDLLLKKIASSRNRLTLINYADFGSVEFMNIIRNSKLSHFALHMDQGMNLRVIFGNISPHLKHLSLSTFDTLNALDTDQVIETLKPQMNSRSKEINSTDLQTIEINCPAFSCIHSSSSISRCTPGNLERNISLLDFIAEKEDLTIEEAVEEYLSTFDRFDFSFLQDRNIWDLISALSMSKTLIFKGLKMRYCKNFESLNLEQFFQASKNLDYLDLSHTTFSNEFNFSVEQLNALILNGTQGIPVEKILEKIAKSNSSIREIRVSEIDGGSSLQRCVQFILQLEGIEILDLSLLKIAEFNYSLIEKPLREDFPLLNLTLPQQ